LITSPSTSAGASPTTPSAAAWTIAPRFVIPADGRGAGGVELRGRF
jgi:hypothetical protein